MRKKFQYSWHDIMFENFIDVSHDKIADTNFYDNFYLEFFKKYHSYSDIPDDYISKKMVVVKYLKPKIRTRNSVLSIGCGIGLIEKLLVENLDIQTKITAVEPSKSAIKLIKNETRINVYNGFFPSVFDKISPQFDFAYARAIEYIFDQDEYVKFLKSILDYGINEFSIISVSIQRTTISDVLKEVIKTFLNRLNLYKRGQLWGFVRTEYDHREAFLRAGFKTVNFEKLDYSTIVITGKV